MLITVINGANACLCCYCCCRALCYILVDSIIATAVAQTDVNAAVVSLLSSCS